MDRNSDTVFCDRFQDCCPEKVYPLRNSVLKDVKQTDGEILSLQHYGKYLATIPPLNRVSEEFGVMFKDKYVDLDMQHDLERSEVLNWCRTTKELFPIRTTADGNCLLHAISQGMWGIEDTECLLRRVVYVNLVTDAKGMFKKRWIFHHRNLNTVDCCEEWEAVVKAIDDVSKSQTHGLPYTALESIHLYVSANMLKRPIIVIADPMARTAFGQTVQDSQISGVYLPLEWSPEHCHKSPIVIGYSMNHFAPLMFEDAAGCNDTSIQAVPLVTKAMDSLPIRFLMPNEEMNIRNILSDYLHNTEVFYNTTTVPAVKVKTRTLPSELNVLEACLLDCERKFRRLMGEDVPPVNPPNKIVMQPFQFEMSKKAPKPAAPTDQRLNDVLQRDRHGHENGENQQRCITIGCKYFANPETQNLCTKCFRDFTIQFARQKEMTRHKTGRQPFVPAQWSLPNQLDPLGIPRPQPPARQGSEQYLNLSLVMEDCHAGCGFKCSVETYPYCHECQPNYNTAQQPRLEPPRQIESSVMPDKCNNPTCKYRCSEATFPYCHTCYDLFVTPPFFPGIVAPASSQAPIPGFSAVQTANASTSRSPQLSNKTYSALQKTHESKATHVMETMDVGSLDRPCKTVNCKNNAVKGNNGYCDNCYNLTLFGSGKCLSPGCLAAISVPESTQCLMCFLKRDINQSGRLRSLTGGAPQELGLNIVPTPEQKILNSARSPELQLAGSLSGTSLRSNPTEHDETAGQHQIAVLTVRQKGTMLSQENWNFIRFLLLLFTAGTKLLVKIMQKSLVKEAKTIDQLLTAPGMEEKVRRSKLITTSMKDKLYPPNQVTRDVSEWDITLLSFIILEFLKQHLNTPQKLAVEKIRDFRNEFCHKPEPAIDGNTFTDKWTKLVLMFNTISHGMSQDDWQYFNNIITSVSEVELDSSVAIEEIKSSVLGCDGDIKSIHQNIKKLEILLQLDSKVEEIKENVSDLTRRTSDLERKTDAIENVSDLTRRTSDLERKTDTILEIVLRIQAAEKHTKDDAEKHLYQASKDRLDEEPSNEFLMAVRENVDKLASEIEQEGNVISDVRKGSVIWKVICNSSEAMMQLEDYCKGPQMQKCLKNIAGSLERLFGETIHLDAQIKADDKTTQDPWNIKEENEMLKSQTIFFIQKVYKDQTLSMEFLPFRHLATCADYAPAIGKYSGTFNPETRVEN